MPYTNPVPPRAVALSAGALAVSVVGTVLFPQGMADYGYLVWVLPMIPAFLLCYYRRWTRLMISLAAVMVLVSVGYVAIEALGMPLPEWPFFAFVIAAYIGIALGAGWFAELRVAVKERTAAATELRQAYLDLRRSHSDLQLAQWKLIEAEKLEAVGQLAAGVAHEVKNPLMTLLTGVRYLQHHAPSLDGAVRTLLEDMHEAVKRADRVITGLLDFATPRELTLAPADLNGVIARSGGLVKHEIDRARVALELDLAHDLAPLSLDVFKIQQVLVNVLTNAAHATPPGGQITVRTYRKGLQLPSDAPDSGPAAGMQAAGEVVMLEVDDTGTGVPAHALDKLFDPFFTTKPAGKGTGLGLAVSRQIIEMHGGSIHVANRPDGGARVTIAFGPSRSVAHGS